MPEIWIQVNNIDKTKGIISKCQQVSQLQWRKNLQFSFEFIFTNWTFTSTDYIVCWQIILYIDRLHCILTDYAVYWLYCVLTDSVSILGSCRVDRRGVLERHFEDIKENSQKQTTQLHPRIQKRQFTSNPRSGQVNLLCSLINH